VRHDHVCPVQGDHDRDRTVYHSETGFHRRGRRDNRLVDSDNHRGTGRRGLAGNGDMSLRPVRSRRRRQSKYSRLRAEAEYKPWKGWNWNSTKKKGFELFGRKPFVIFLLGLALTIGLAAMYSDSNNPLFHSYAHGTGVSITNVH